MNNMDNRERTDMTVATHETGARVPIRTRSAAITTDIEEIGPKEAKFMLGVNTHNRTIRQSRVDTMVRDMKAGKWQLNGESIKFSVTNRLLDGQHRLLAIVESGVSVPMVVVRGLSDADQETIDIGDKRHMGDILHLAGEANTTNLGSVLRFCWSIETYGRRPSGGIHPSPQELATYLKDNPDIRESVKIGNRANKAALRYPQSVAGGLHYLMSKIDGDQADAFWEQLIEGTAPAGSPVNVLRETLLRDLARLHRMSIWQRAAITIKAWNLMRDDKTITILLWRSAGRLAEPFPKLR